VELALTKRGDYVLRAATDLAAAWSRDGGYRKIRDISEEMAIPSSYTPSILGLLARAGLAQSRAGRYGGYRLVRPPSKISMLEVIEAAEGPLSIDRCPMRGGPCRWDDSCAFHPAWSKATDSLRRSLARTSLASVVADDRRLAAGRPVEPVPPPGHRRPGRR
jgi:Rrf2 family protein